MWHANTVIDSCPPGQRKSSIKIWMVNQLIEKKNPKKGVCMEILLL